MRFIEWCNQNTGFVSLLLSTLTLVVSFLAITVSVYTAQLPYKKKILIVCGSYISEGGTGFHITATNIGNRDVYVKTIGFLINDMIYINKNNIFESVGILKQGEMTSQYFCEEEIRSLIKKNKIGSWTKVWAMIEDSEGKRYKKKLTRAGRI